MLISILFVSIIIVYGFIGLKKGGIKSIGGLISMILSFILSRCLAIPVTQYVCNESGISDKISCFIQNINSSVFLNENVFLLSIDMIKTQLLNLKKYQRRIGLYQKIVKRNISLYLTLVLYSVMSEVRRIQKRRKKQQNQKSLSLSRKVFEVLTYIPQ